MARQANGRIWKAAVPLADACVHFANDDDRSSFENEDGFLGTLSKLQEGMPPAEILKTVLAATQSKNRRDILLREMRNNLLNDLAESKLIAIGIRQRPSRGTYPVSINAEVFGDPDVNWEKSTVEWLGTAYSQVRVFTSSNLNKHVDGPSARGSRAALDRAISELIKDNAGFCDEPRKKACQIVRERLSKIEIKGNGLSDQNISKRILLICPKRAL